MVAARRLRFPIAVLLLVVCALLTLSRSGVTAQQQLSDQALWGIYWTVQPGFTSTLEMKNNLVAEPLSVSVSLYFANGEEYPLSPVQLGPRQTAIIDLNHAIESLPRAVAARAGQEGTLEVEFVAPTPSALMGSVSVANPERGIAWNFFLYHLRSGLPIAPVRGLFWFPNSAADGFVAIQNVSEEFLSVAPRFHIAGQAYPLAPISLAPGQGYKLNFRAELRKLGLDDVTGGGIELRYEGVADALKAHGVLFDNRGFSAEVDFTRFESWDEAQTVTLRTPRFAVGQADPRLGLPAPTVFEPVLALHNFNAHALDVTLLVGYRVGTQNHQQSIPMSMAPGDTRTLQLHPLLRGVIPADVPWASLELSYTDRQTGLAAAMVSVSEDGAHSIRSVLNWVRGNIREGWYWRADADHTTVLGIFNSDTEEAQLAVSLDYSVAGVTHSYELPLVSIGPQSAQNIDIGEVISSGIPDADGDVLPSSVSFGGYRVRKLNRIQANVTTEALVIDRRKKSYLTFYNTACCVSFPRFTPTEINGAFGGTFQIEIHGTNTCTTEDVDLTGQGWHASRNTSVATVGASSGSGSLVGVGATYIDSSVIYLRLAPVEECIESQRSGTNSVAATPTVTIVGGRDFAFVGTDPTIQPQPQQAQGNPPGGAYSWSATPSNRVSFDNPTSSEPRLRGINPSTALGDTTLSVTYTVGTESATATRSITARIFKFLQQRVALQTDFNGPELFGYQKEVFYNVYTSPAQQLLEPGFSGIRVTELVEVLESNFPAPLIQGSGSTDDNSELSDLLKLTDSDPLPGEVRILLRQDLFVGGFFNRNNTLTFGPSTVTITNNGPFN